MSRTKPSPAASATPADRSWRNLDVVGAVAALLALAGTLADIVLTMLPGWGTDTVPATIQGWFVQFQTNPLLGLRNLDLLNITLSAIALPLYVALYGAHRRTQPALAALALSVTLVGTAVFIANNAALPMLALSRQYAAAPSAISISNSAEAQRQALEAAGLALLARGAHGSLGAFAGFILSSLGTLLMGLAMLWGRVFSRITAWLGIVGITLLAVYTVVAAFAPAVAQAVMLLAMPGGLLYMAWYVRVAVRLFRLDAAHGAPRE